MPVLLAVTEAVRAYRRQLALDVAALMLGVEHPLVARLVPLDA